MSKKFIALSLALCISFALISTLAIPTSAETITYNYGFKILNYLSGTHSHGDILMTFPSGSTVKLYNSNDELIFEDTSQIWEGVMMPRLYVNNGYKPAIQNKATTYTSILGYYVIIDPPQNLEFNETMLNEIHSGAFQILTYEEFLPDPPSPVEDTLSDTNTVFSSFLGWLGSVTSTIVTSPVLFIFLVGVPIVGAASFWAVGMIRGRRRKK